VVAAPGDAFPVAEFGDGDFAAQAVEHDADLLFRRCESRQVPIEPTSGRPWRFALRRDANLPTGSVSANAIDYGRPAISTVCNLPFTKSRLAEV
jgi:hypothetical protein